MSYTFGSRSAVGRLVSRDAAGRMLFGAIAMCLSIAAGFVIAQEGWLRWATELRKLGVLPLPFWLVGVLGGYALARHVKRDWLSPISIVAMEFAWFFCLGPILQIATGAFHIEMRFTSRLEELLPRAGWLAFLALVMFLLGYERAPSERSIDRLGQLAKVLGTANPARLLVPTGTAMILGTVVLLFRYAGGGGLDYILAERSTPGGSSSWWMGLAIHLAPVACLVAYCYWGCERRLLPTLMVVGMIVVTFGLRAITGRRGWALETVILVLFAARYLEKKFRVNLLTSMAAAVLLLNVLFWLADYRTFGGTSTAAKASGQFAIMLHETTRLRGLMMVLEFIPRVKPHQWGLGFLRYAFQIPMNWVYEQLGISVFSTGNVVLLAYGPTAYRATMASTPVGVLYHEWGVPGVAIGFYLFGRLTKLVYTALVRRDGSPTAIVLYAPFSYFAWSYMIAGSWQAVWDLQVRTGLILLLLFFSRLRNTVQVIENAHAGSGV